MVNKKSVNSQTKKRKESRYLEKHFERDFGKWFELVYDERFDKCPYELKRTVGGTVAFSKFEDQQLPSLIACKTKKGFRHKLTDASLGLKPFDGFIYRECECAYVGIVFYANDKAKREFWFIEIDDVMEIKKEKKSITIKNCRKLGFQLNL